MSVTYEVVRRNAVGHERVHRYAAEEPLGPGSVVILEGRFWLVERVDTRDGEGPDRATAKPARYRLRLVHPDGRQELGVFRRFRPGGPRLGHAFTTLEHGRPASWEVAEEKLAHDEQGEPYLELLAERDFSELEELPDHELEHALAQREAFLPAEAAGVFTRAEAEGLAVELVALDPGEEPDWAFARQYVDGLIFEEIEDDLFELCGVDLNVDPRDSWLSTVKARLHSDLDQLRADIEGDHDEIEEWHFLGGRIFASVGGVEDEADPEEGHGWMCRLVDASALGAAGFARIRKAQLLPPESA